jgi:hypothetical protein
LAPYDVGSSRPEVEVDGEREHRLKKQNEDNMERNVRLGVSCVPFSYNLRSNSFYPSVGGAEEALNVSRKKSGLKSLERWQMIHLERSGLSIQKAPPQPTPRQRLTLVLATQVRSPHVLLSPRRKRQ